MIKLIPNHFKLSETKPSKIFIATNSSNASISLNKFYSAEKHNNIQCLFTDKTLLLKTFYSLRVGTQYLMNYIRNKSLNFTGVKTAMEPDYSSEQIILMPTQNSSLRSPTMNFISNAVHYFFDLTLINN